MIHQISDNTRHKNQEMGSNGFLNKTRFLHFHSTQSGGNYHQQVVYIRTRREGHQLLQSYLFFLFGADKVSIVDCRHASDKKFKTFTFYVPSFWIVYPESILKVLYFATKRQVTSKQSHSETINIKVK